MPEASHHRMMTSSDRFLRRIENVGRAAWEMQEEVLRPSRSWRVRKGGLEA